MKIPSAVLVFGIFSVPTAGALFLPPIPTRLTLSYTGRPSLIRLASTELLETTNSIDDFDLDVFEAELDASLQLARDALLESENDDSKFPAEVLEREIDDALIYAESIVEELQQEQDAYRLYVEDDDDRIDADVILGEQRSKEMVESLAQGLIDAESFQDFLEERRYATLLLRESTIEQARLVLLQKQNEGRLLKQEIFRIKTTRLRREATLQTIAVGLDGCLIGCSFGLFLWAAIPEYLGDNVNPALPAFGVGGLFACLCIVASTAQNSFVAYAMNKIKFGFISRTMIAVIGSILRILLSVSRGLLKGFADGDEIDDMDDGYR